MMGGHYPLYFFDVYFVTDVDECTNSSLYSCPTIIPNASMKWDLTDVAATKDTGNCGVVNTGVRISAVLVSTAKKYCSMIWQDKGREEGRKEGRGRE